MTAFRTDPAQTPLLLSGDDKPIQVEKLHRGANRESVWS
jgi:hypothetical protein